MRGGARRGHVAADNTISAWNRWNKIDNLFLIRADVVGLAGARRREIAQAGRTGADCMMGRGHGSKQGVRFADTTELVMRAEEQKVLTLVVGLGWAPKVNLASQMRTENGTEAAPIRAFFALKRAGKPSENGPSERLRPPAPSARILHTNKISREKLP